VKTPVGASNSVLNGVQIPMRRGNFDWENVSCTANAWLKEQNQQFPYNEIGKRWTMSISVAGDCVENYKI